MSRHLGILVAFAARLGALLWEVQAGEFDKFDSSPAFNDGLVVTGAGSFTLLAVDTVTWSDFCRERRG